MTLANDGGHAEIMELVLSSDPQKAEAGLALQKLVEHRSALLKVVEEAARASVAKRIDKEKLKQAVNLYSAKYGWPVK